MCFDNFYANVLLLQFPSTLSNRQFLPMRNTVRMEIVWLIAPEKKPMGRENLPEVLRAVRTMQQSPRVNCTRHSGSRMIHDPSTFLELTSES